MAKQVSTYEFGFYPEPLSITTPCIEIETLPGLDDAVRNVSNDRQRDKDWYYAPPQAYVQLGVTTAELKPYSRRVFALPKTHLIRHKAAEGPEHIAFHMWALSFFLGLRLTASEAGFLDATPIRAGKLVDFAVLGDKAKAVSLAEDFWHGNLKSPDRARQLGGAIHALMLSQNPLHLQFEEFMYLYLALDSCFALARSLNPSGPTSTHALRVDWMCRLFGIATPPWAMNTPPDKGTVIAALRNETLHEALFMGEPLGFAPINFGANGNLLLELRGLVCRFIVALIAGTRPDYVRSPFNDRQRHLLKL